MDLTDREATLIVAALARFSHDFEAADAALADEAWALVETIAAERGIDPATAVRELR